MSHLVSCKFINLSFHDIMLSYNIWVEYLKWYVAYFFKFHVAFPIMLKINFTSVIGLCLRSSGVVVECGVLLQPTVAKDICIKLLFLVHIRCWFCATKVISNIVFNCYLCICSLTLYNEKEQKKQQYGDLYVKQIINMSRMGKWGGSWGGIFGYDLLKEVRYIFNE
jgi:hypothetical protein